jgi:hypothetical protein
MVRTNLDEDPFYEGKHLGREGERVLKREHLTRRRNHGRRRTGGELNRVSRPVQERFALTLKIVFLILDRSVDRQQPRVMVEWGPEEQERVVERRLSRLKLTEQGELACVRVDAS